MATERPRLNIPKQELPSFKLLARTSPSTLQKLTDTLGEQPPCLDVEKLAAAVAKVSEIEQSIVEELLPLVWRWTMVQRRLDIGTEEFISSLTEGLENTHKEEWTEKDRAGWNDIKEALKLLLSSDTAISLGAKAGELLLDQQLLLCSSRVITDARPVFNDSAEQLKGILPYHTLVLRCHEGNNNRDMHIALDSDDLVLLRQQLERAEQKEKLLNSTLREAGLIIIETGSNEEEKSE